MNLHNQKSTEIHQSYTKKEMDLKLSPLMIVISRFEMDM